MVDTRNTRGTLGEYTCVEESVSLKAYVVGYCFWDNYHGDGMQPLVVVQAASDVQAIEKAKAWASLTLTGKELESFLHFSKPRNGGSISLGAQEIPALLE